MDYAEGGLITTSMDYAAMAKTLTTRKRRRTRLVRVNQGTIDIMLKHERPHRPLPEFHESIDLLRPGFRAYIASISASLKKYDDRDADILRQYRAKGYAEIELVAEELDDDEDDGAETEERVAVADGAPMPAKKK